ncbi:hypothetical protein [Xanthomonas vasicola]|uniref:hypothetical protein n=1 Tax=Xanthomonas vasicola TaxID=56459 RepID=UPI00068FD23E|nr:hypothetical protein [Xanthomonas vasicola]TWQ40718.1 hypothetical protein FQJ96_06090 [Xanthomonas vasicola]TWQ61113.1 hypothetical protein FQJ93_03915 [Xanthomonas vasicola]
MRPTLCLFLSIATFALPISAAEKKPIRPATANELAMLKAAMQSVLKDPDSAKYESVIVGTKPESKNLICGRVNSKNGFGGYSGMVSFVGLLAEYEGTSKKDVVILKVDSPDPDDGEAAAKLCLKQLFNEDA